MEFIRRRRHGRSQLVRPMGDGSMLSRLQSLENNMGNVSAQNLRGARMTVNVALPEVTPAFAAYYPDDRRHRARQERLAQRQQAAREQNRQAVRRKGINILWASIGIGLLALVLFLIWLPGRLEANEVQRRVTRLEAQISDVEESCTALQAEYDTKVAGVNIGYEAVEIGMISAKGVKAVELSVPAGVSLEPAD